jgi:hypothetical protein
MSDYYSLIAGTVSRLPSKNDEAGHALYERARTALQERLHTLDPPISVAELGDEETRLEAAISRVESELLLSIMQRFASEEATRDTSLVSAVTAFVGSVVDKLRDNIPIMRARLSEATKAAVAKADITARLAQGLEFAQRTQLKAKIIRRRLYLSVFRYER